VFSTYLYTGNESTQTITNGIDLSGKGGLVWIKSRSSFSATEAQQPYHFLSDTTKTSRSFLSSNTTNALASNLTISSFNSNGFSLDDQPDGASYGGRGNLSGVAYASWTFRKQPKFFDVVTWSGNGTIGRTISHSLGSVPGCIIVKKTNSAGSSDWVVYHRSLGATKAMILNLTDSVYTWSVWNDTAPTSTVFSLNDASEVNGAGNSYVAYLFAHNAGGFGLTGTDNVISCGSYTGNGSSSGPTVTLGYEPQWLLVKNATSVRNWFLVDNMRGLTVGGVDPILQPNSSSAEQAGSSYDYFSPTATGFSITNSDGDVNASGSTYIYIAIRRGPMKVPTDATKVFNPVLAATTPPAFRSSNFNSGVDSGIEFYTPGYPGYSRWSSRLTGVGLLATSSTAAETTTNVYNTWDYMNGYFNYSGLGTDGGSWMFRRAPSFFDEVCYTGTGSATNYSHNLGVAPQLIILKSRSSAVNWYVMYSGTSYMILNNTNGGANGSGSFDLSLATASTFYLGADGGSGYNGSGSTYVAYLFATCAGVSKVGSYTGTGATQTINCGFGASGSRFVLVKRTDSTGDWYVWDSARGMVSGTDPSLLLNSTAAEVNANSVYAVSTGFQIVSTAAGINASGGSYIFLSIA
jgi:hypothetical protein